jgi:hypothetical protein
MYTLVTGTGSPLAPPLPVTRLDAGATGTCVPGIAHEGPPGYGHGGSAMLLDELMGWACATAGMPGMTVSLQMRYHRSVPLESPLLHGPGGGRGFPKTPQIRTEASPVTTSTWSSFARRAVSEAAAVLRASNSTRRAVVVAAVQRLFPAAGDADVRAEQTLLGDVWCCGSGRW